MLKNLLNLTSTYVDGHVAAETKLAKDQTELRGVYNTSSSAFAEKLTQTNEVYDRTVSELYESSKAQVQAAFSDAKQAVNAAVSAPVDPAVLQTVALLGGLTNPSQAEVKAVLEGVKNSYLGTRAVIEKFDLQEDRITIDGVPTVQVPPSVDEVLSDLNWLEDYIISNVFKSQTQTFAQADNYHVASILSGDMVNRVESVVTGFVDQFSPAKN